ncbi:MAG: hypothetical protein ABJA78_04455 [Ferruginibacter sp.]
MSTTSSQQKNSEQSRPLKKEDIAKNPDHKIDEDFPGYPHGQSKDKIIKPQNENDRKTADTDHKDGEKMNIPKNRRPIDESKSDGSGGAFEATEKVDD